MAWWNEGVFDSPCWRFVLPGLNFAANKNVTIKDWRLGIILRFLQAATLAYVAWDIVNQQSYLLRKPPTISFQAISVGGQRFMDARNQAVQNPPTYCTNTSSYSYSLEAVTQDTTIAVSTEDMAPIKCEAIDPQVMAISIGPSTILVGTYLQEEVTRFRENVSSIEACPDPIEILGLEDGPYAKPVQFYSGTCQYSFTKQTFPYTPENITVGFSFSYTLPPEYNAAGSSETVTCGLKTDFDSDVTTELEGNQLFIAAPLWKWLEYTNVDLDKPITQRGTRDGSKQNITGIAPMTRVTGMEMLFDVAIYNENLQPYGSSVDGTACVIEIKPTLFWTAGPTQVFRLWDQGPNSGTSSVQMYGVMFNFVGGGNFGIFSYKLLINALVAGAVLLSVAHTFTTYLALYTLGVRSQLYSAFINESCDYQREFARYASQCLVAADYFKRKDTNKTATLDKLEVFRALREIYRDMLTTEEICALTDFVIHVGDRTNTAADEEDATAGNIALAEWFNCFTGDRCDASMLKRIIGSDYTEKEMHVVKKELEGLLAKDHTTHGIVDDNCDDIADELDVQLKTEDPNGTKDE
mmetsp:Transcript_7043/g.19860  ORF Transcript_7043/g.19860 Transcript_7043/m.19860 type:complete len:580 (-) Transcript_7043:127-1866(-)